MATLTLTAAAATDDAVINDLGYGDNVPDTAGDTTHQVGTPGSATTAANSGQGWRFTNVTIAGSATINSAILKLMKYNTQFSTYACRWTTTAEDNAATFSSGSAPGSRAINSANIAVESLNTNQTDGTVYNHPSTSPLQATLGASVGQVTARGSWASGNSMAIVNQSKQDASQGTGFSRKSFHCQEDTAASSDPQLVIDYTPAATSIPNKVFEINQAVNRGATY